MSNNTPNNTDMTVLFDWMKRLEDKFEGLSSRLEEKMDSNYDTLEKKINEYIESSSKNLDSVKDKLQDHEYRIRGIEATSKSSNDKVIELLTKTISDKDKKDEGFFKKFTKMDSVIIIVILVLVFVSGKFDIISGILKAFFIK
jgi:Skp family chaperone for outer membrane proteins